MDMEDRAKISNRDEFYIGYRKMPVRLRVFSLVVAFVLLLASSGLAFGLYLAQKAPPTTRLVRAPVLGGIFQADPYPMLHIAPTAEDPDGGTVLMHRPGKHGVPADKARELNGKPVQVGGAFFTRDGTRLLQVGLSGGNQLRLADPDEVDTSTWVAFTPEPLGHFRLKGKIVDHKCFLGGMIPGQGKTHRGCATYCLASGVPPMFASFRPDGSLVSYVLARPDGKALGPDALKYVAAPIEVEGEVERVGDLLVFKIDLDSIRRL
ncbi:MAG: hypothetical protein V3U67_06730 [Gemmatimonadota bacterium]